MVRRTLTLAALVLLFAVSGAMAGDNSRHDEFSLLLYTEVDTVFAKMPSLADYRFLSLMIDADDVKIDTLGGDSVSFVIYQEVGGKDQEHWVELYRGADHDADSANFPWLIQLDLQDTATYYGGGLKMEWTNAADSGSTSDSTYTATGAMWMVRWIASIWSGKP